jgi:DNA-binding XRE family transcriptional regulator
MATAPKKAAPRDRTTYKERFKHGARFPLRGVREALDVTQMQAAERSGLAQSEISKIERGSLDDRELGTLRRYVEGIGGKLETVVVLPAGQRFIIVDPE